MLLETLQSDNENLKCELVSCQNELEVFVESSHELEALVASKDSELIALRHGTKAESNLYIEKLQEAKNQCKAFEDQVLGLESQASRWECKNRELDIELKSAQEKCKTFEDNMKSLQECLNDEKERKQHMEVKFKEEMVGEVEARERAVRDEEGLKAGDREKEIQAEKEELVEELGALQNELEEMRPMVKQIGMLSSPTLCQIHMRILGVLFTVSGNVVIFSSHPIAPVHFPEDINDSQLWDLTCMSYTV